jgi:Dolichyl-phosphate-mannose-protein mannosyltransferase
MPAHESSHRKAEIICLIIVLAVGIFFRLPQSAFSGDGNPLHALECLHPIPKYTEMGMLGADEDLYRRYIIDLVYHGLASYPVIVEHYIELQMKAPKALLPPTRFLYIFTSYVWHCCFGTDPIGSLDQVASCFSILTLIVSGIFACRLADRGTAISLVALMSCAPTQIHMSQHGMIDGFFTFWALLCLWTMWESLRAPGDWRWLVGYMVALVFLVITKENSFFVWVALCAIILTNKWLKFGVAGRNLVVATIVGPLLGLVILIFLAGGLDNLLTTYRLLVSKASQSPYAILTGDGPWYRYLVDLLLVSPLVLLLAFGTIFRLDRTKKPELYMAIFIAATYLVMCNVKYGMNLRYANMWDMPLRFLAFGQISVLAALVPRYRAWLTVILVGLVAGFELRQYYILAVQYPLYELITHDLLRALHLLK